MRKGNSSIFVIFADGRPPIHLYVISHQEQDVVEKFLFDQQDNKLTHKRTIANESDFIR